MSQSLPTKTIHRKTPGGCGAEEDEEPPPPAIPEG